MKKIFMASLVAMMAVTAANAEIASTNFVTDRTGDVAKSTYVKTLEAGKQNLAGAVDDLDNRISNMSEVTGETLSDLGTQIGNAQSDATSALNQIAALDNTYVTDTAFNADKEVQDGKITALETSLSDTGKTGKAIAAAHAQANKGVADAAAAQGDATSALNQIAALDNTYVTDTAFNADKTAQDNKISALETSLSANGTTGKAIAAAQSDVDTVETNLGPLNGVKIANACTTGRCALVWENGQAKWETINY